MSNESRFNNQQVGIGGPAQHSTRLSAEDREFLRKAGIDEKRMAGVYSVQQLEQLPTEFTHYGKHALPGMVFLWQPTEGSTLRQLRRHGVNGRGDYQFPKGAEMVLAIPNGYRERVKDLTKPLVIVEGTKQYLAVASALGDDDSFAVVGVSGCQGWKKEGRPIACFHHIPLEGREVIIWFDADISGNRAVHDAAKELQERLRIEFGTAVVRFVQMPGNSKDGADDLLGPHKPERRPEIARTLIREAKAKLPRRPAAQREDRFAPQFFKQTARGDKFAPTVMWQYLQQQHPMAITREISAERGTLSAIAVYQNGVYLNGMSRQFQRTITRALGDDFERGHIDLATEFALNELTAARRVMPERQERFVVNCTNGLVDVMTGQLLHHDPNLLTTFQLPIAYNPDAQCPNYERWLEDRLPGQTEALEDVACQVLDMTRTPQRFLYLYGPPRSGKSTFLRIMTAVVGRSNTSAVTLHQLSDDAFASANLYGKVLNTAADLSSKDVRDLSTLKMLTGEDSINANRKYGSQFSFVNQALLAFSSNDLPTVSDATGAYQERAIPFRFASQFIGREDPNIEQDILRELPGILNRWLRALQSHRQRGGYLGTDQATREHFARQSNRVADFLAEMTRPSENPIGTPRSMLWAAWRQWAEEVGVQAGGRNHFFEKVRGCGALDFKQKGAGHVFPVALIDHRSALLEPDGPLVTVLTQNQNPVHDTSVGTSDPRSAVLSPTPRGVRQKFEPDSSPSERLSLKTADPGPKLPTAQSGKGLSPGAERSNTAEKLPETAEKLQTVTQRIEQVLAEHRLDPSHPQARNIAADALVGTASKQQVTLALEQLRLEDRDDSQEDLFN